MTARPAATWFFRGRTRAQQFAVGLVTAELLQAPRALHRSHGFDRSDKRGRQAQRQHQTAQFTFEGLQSGDEKRAEQLLMPQANAAQLMLVMENRHKQWIMQNFPAYSGKVWLMGHWNQQSEVADPIGKGPNEFDACLKVLEGDIDLWLPKLRALL